MSQPEPPEALDPAVVQALARLQAYAPLEPALAARIAAGASAALGAVAVYAGVCLIEAEPVQFLAELERLAGDD